MTRPVGALQIDVILSSARWAATMAPYPTPGLGEEVVKLSALNNASVTVLLLPSSDGHLL